MTDDRATRPATDDADQGSRRDRRCPICGKPALADYAPFCSKRCADIDLHRWLGGVYALPAAAEPDDDEQPSD